jgi:hypothetical protein
MIFRVQFWELLKSMWPYFILIQLLQWNISCSVKGCSIPLWLVASPTIKTCAHSSFTDDPSALMLSPLLNESVWQSYIVKAVPLHVAYRRRSFTTLLSKYSSLPLKQPLSSETQLLILFHCVVEDREPVAGRFLMGTLGLDGEREALG